MTGTIETNNRIMHSTTKSSSRYSIKSPYLKVKDGVGRMAATDGRIASVRPVAILGKVDDMGAFLPVSGMKRPTKSPKSYRITPNSTGASFQALKGAKLDDDGLPVVGEYVDGTFPPIADVFPRAGKYAAIAVSPTLLAAAMGAAQGDIDGHGLVVLYIPIVSDFTESSGYELPTEMCNKPMLIAGTGDDGGASVLMPVHVANQMSLLKKARSLFGFFG